MIRILRKWMNDCTTTDLVFTAVVLGSMVVFGTGNALVAKQLVELKQMRADFEEQRVDMCIDWKAHALVYHFDSSSMRDYCLDVIGYMPLITPLPKPEN
ncbi:hypothetical protein [Rhizobium phage RHEph12]|nr:hypothetical protein [Rhizobium phage RHEph12]